MRRKAKQTIKILCANKVGAGTVRYAVQVSQGRDVERVVIVDVERRPEGFSEDRNGAAMVGAAQDRARSTQCSGAKGTRIVGVVFNEVKFTGLGQHAEATQPIGGGR